MVGRFAATCAGAAVILVAGAAWAQPRYQIRPIEGLPECAGTAPQALDQRGQVVGGHCLWNPSGVLPPPDAAHPGAFADSLSQGVAAGHAVDEDLLAVPVIWVDGQPRVLPLGAGFRQGLALVINANRDVLGQMSGGPSGTQLALWSAAGNPTVITLSPKAGNRDPRDLNQRGQVVGCASFSGVFGGNIVPFLWSNGQTRVLEPSSWSEPSGCAYAINDGGVVAGESGQRPVLWRDGSLQRLAPRGLVGQALDVNERGAVVGMLDGRPFYSDGTSVWDLFGLIDDQALVATLGRIIAINDLGQVLVTRPTPTAPLAGVALLEPKGPPAGPDTNPPAVTMTSPWNGEPLGGRVTLKAAASDDVGVVGVQFFANGARVGAEDTTAPYAVEVEIPEPPAAMSFYARARDAAGNVTSTPLRFATSRQSTVNSRQP